jgi:hypothetical protein
MGRFHWQDDGDVLSHAILCELDVEAVSSFANEFDIVGMFLIENGFDIGAAMWESHS